MEMVLKFSLQITFLCLFPSFSPLSLSPLLILTDAVFSELYTQVDACQENHSDFLFFLSCPLTQFQGVSQEEKKVFGAFI